jgi:hypothetical protein
MAAPYISATDALDRRLVLFQDIGLQAAVAWTLLST